MWIFLGILLFLACVVTIILLLPIYIIIKSDATDAFYFRCKFLGKTLGGKPKSGAPKSDSPKSENPFAKALKTASGLSRLEKDSIKKNIQENNLCKAVQENFILIADLLKEILSLVKRCKAKVFRLKIVCSDDDPAEASIKYGACCMAVYPILDYLFSYIRMKPRVRDVDISWDFEGGNSMFAFETVLVLRVHQVLGTFLHIIIAEAKRTKSSQKQGH